MEKLIRRFVSVFCITVLIGVIGCENDDNSGSGSEDPDAGVTQFAGNWSGTYTGEENGTWSCTADSSGAIHGSTSGPYGNFSLVGSVTSDGNFAATAGDVTTGASFTGQMSTTGAMNGTWHNPSYGLRGTFTGTRQ